MQETLIERMNHAAAHCETMFDAEWEAEQLRHGAKRIEVLEANLRPDWDEAGEAATLAAAAEDADEWMALIERLHDHGRGPWKFSEPDSLEKLRGCRRALRRFLTPNAEVTGLAPEKGD